MKCENNCYFPSNDDPLGETHISVKYKKLELEYFAMMYIAMQNGGDRMQELTCDRLMRKSHGERWEKAKESAKLYYLDGYKNLNKTYEKDLKRREKLKNKKAV